MDATKNNSIACVRERERERASLISIDESKFTVHISTSLLTVKILFKVTSAMMLLIGRLGRFGWTAVGGDGDAVCWSRQGSECSAATLQ